MLPKESNPLRKRTRCAFVLRLSGHAEKVDPTWQSRRVEYHLVAPCVEYAIRKPGYFAAEDVVDGEAIIRYAIQQEHESR